LIAIYLVASLPSGVVISHQKQATELAFVYFTGVFLTADKRRHPELDLIHAQDTRFGVAAWLALDKHMPVIPSCPIN